MKNETFKQRFVKEPNFEPRQSSRISTRVEADNDQWAEYLTIVDLLNPRTKTYELQIRSFFESKATSKKVWDEPPSGAKNVIWASDNSKQMAEEQMKDLRAVGTENQNHSNADGNWNGSHPQDDPLLTANTNGKKKRFSWIRKLSSIIMNTSSSRPKQQEIKKAPRNLVYQRGSRTDEFCLGAMREPFSRSRSTSRLKSKSKSKYQNGPRVNDINLQHALAHSLGMADVDVDVDVEAKLNKSSQTAAALKPTNLHQTGHRDHGHDIYTEHDYDHGHNPLHEYETRQHREIEDEEALAMAKALSISESEYRQDQDWQTICCGDDNVGSLAMRCSSLADEHSRNDVEEPTIVHVNVFDKIETPSLTPTPSLTSTPTSARDTKMSAKELETFQEQSKENIV